SRVGWANDYLKRAGLTHSPARGMWQLTPQGGEWVERFREGAPEEEIDRLIRMSRRRALESSSVPEQPASNAPLAQDASPEEQIDQAFAEIRESLKLEILERIGQCSPEFFERLVLDLLLAMGYGLNHTSLRQTGGAGD